MNHKKYQFSPFVYFAGKGGEKPSGDSAEKAKEAPEEKPEQDESPEDENKKTKDEAAKLVEGADKSAESYEEKPEKKDGKVTVEVAVKLPKDSTEVSAEGTKNDIDAGGSLAAEYVPGDSGKPHLAYTLTLKGDFASKTDLPSNDDVLLKDSTRYTATVLPGLRAVLPLGPIDLYAGVGLGGSVSYVESTSSTRGTPVLQDSTDWKVGGAAVGTLGARVQLGQWRLMGEVQKSTDSEKPAVYVGAGYTF